MDIRIAHPFSFVNGKIYLGKIYLAYLQLLVLVNRLGTVHLV
jgi:hypothetical protein